MQIREAAGLVGDEQQEENPQDSFHFPLLKGKKERKQRTRKKENERKENQNDPLLQCSMICN